MTGARQLRRYDKGLEYSYTFGVFPTLELLTHRPERVQRVVAHSRGERGEGLARVAERCAALGVPFETNDRAVERLAH